MSRDITPNYSPEPHHPDNLYNFDLNYDLLPGPRSITPFPFEPSQQSFEEATTPDYGSLAENDELNGLAGTPSYSTVSLGSTPETAPPVVDLTSSPPLERRPPMGAAASTSQPPDNYLDITAASTSHDWADMAPRRRTNQQLSAGTSRRQPSRRASTTSSQDGPVATGGHRRKRRRMDAAEQELELGNVQDTLCQPTSQPARAEAEIEEVDLTEVNDPSSLANALSRQREDAVKAALEKSHSQDEEGRTILTSYKCPICMDVLQDATSTVCGHLFCHRCIVDTLKFSELQRAEDTVGKAKGTCPVCRKPMIRNDKSDRTRTLVPLALKLQVVPRGVDKGKAKEVV